MGVGKAEELRSLWPKNTVRGGRWLEVGMEGGAKEEGPRAWIWAVEAAIKRRKLQRRREENKEVK